MLRDFETGYVYTCVAFEEIVDIHPICSCSQVICTTTARVGRERLDRSDGLSSKHRPEVLPLRVDRLRRAMRADLARSGLTLADARDVGIRPMKGDRAALKLGISKVNLSDGYAIP